MNERLSDEPFHYSRCARCGSYQLLNVPEDLGAFYPSGYYDQIDAGLSEADARLATGQVEIVSRFRSSGRVLDIGPARGAFLMQAAQRGFGDLAAVERDHGCCEALRAAGVEVVETDDPVAGLEQLAPADAVTMFHSIEHVPDPMGLLDAAADRVLDGGVLVTATPNPQALSFRICGRWWCHADAPRHTHILPLDVLRRRAERNGLRFAGVTTTDPVGILCNYFAWTPWAEHVTWPFGARAAFHFRALAQTMTRSIERRGMLGSTYTAVFRRA